MRCQFYGDFGEFIGGAIHDNRSPAEKPAYGIYVTGSDNLFERIKIFNHGGFGIHNYCNGCGANEPARNVYRFNEIYNTGFQKKNNPAALLLSAGSGLQAYGNIIRNNSFDGISVGHGAINALVYNNTVVNNEVSGITWGNQTGAVIRNNMLSGNGQDFYDYNGTAVTRSNNLCAKSGTGCGVVGNPMFINPGANRYDLQPGSPAINNGATLSGIPAVDIAGTPRPQGGSWDIGAYEYR